jgi:SAM-dependent methyltransferase
MAGSDTGFLQHFTSASYGDAFADVYDEICALDEDTAGAVALLRDLAGSGPIIELGVGTGRLALPLADAGVPVWGVDASEAMLARLDLRRAGRDIRLVRGGLEHFVLPAGAPRFGVAVLAWNTLFCLLSVTAQEQCLRRATESLGEGGHVVLDAYVPFEGFRPPGGFVEIQALDVDRLVLRAYRQDATDPAVVIGQTVVFREGACRLLPWALRPCGPDALDTLAAGAGLVLVDRFGGWARQPFGSGAARHVSVYRRAPG